VVNFDAGSVPDGTAQFTAGPVGHGAVGGLSTAVPPVAPGMLGMPDMTYGLKTDTRSPMPPAPVPLSSLPVNLSSPSQPPLYQPSPLPANTAPPGTSAPVDPTSGIGGPPPPPPTGGFVPSHGIVTATPGKVSELSVTYCLSIILITRGLALNRVYNSSRPLDRPKYVFALVTLALTV